MTRQVLQQALLRVVADTGNTVLFITQSIDEALVLSDRLVVMSARSGRVKAIYDNDLRRPRSMDVQITDRFLELKRGIWDLVQEEVFGSCSSAERSGAAQPSPPVPRPRASVTPCPHDDKRRSRIAHGWLHRDLQQAQ